MELTNEEIMERVGSWQNAGFVHPLTCYDSKHPPLVPVLKKESWGEIVVLECAKCKRQQKVPLSILTVTPEELNQEKERLKGMGFKFPVI